ncbi:unnamed protein product, partial [marine sediment metagenome]
HKAGKIRIAICHLDRKSKVSDIFKETQEERNVVIFEIAFTYNKEGYVKTPD